MNKLDMKTRVQILSLLCEGMSMRAVARVADVSFNTVAKALVDAGTVCAEMHDELVHDVKASRIHMRRFTRLTNGHSKTVANHAHMVALYTLFYNFIRTHGKLRMTPAMAAGITTTFLSFEDVLARIDAAQAPKTRGPYRPRAKISN